MAPHPVPVGPVTPFSASVSPMSWRSSVTDVLDLDHESRVAGFAIGFDVESRSSEIVEGI